MYGNSFSVIGSGYQVLWLRPLQTQKSTSALHPAAQICSQNQMTDQACTMAVAVARIHGFHSFPVKFIFIIPEIWVSSRTRYLWRQAPKGKGFRCAPRKAPLAGELARRSRGGEVVSHFCRTSGGRFKGSLVYRELSAARLTEGLLLQICIEKPKPQI